jgi:hypothetical protein
MTPSNRKLLAKIKARLAPPPEPVDDGAAMDSLLAQLAVIGTRRKAVAGWREPSAAERVAILRRVEATFRRLFGD